METTRCGDALAKKIMRKGMTAVYMRRHAFRFISSKRICYILFIECINSPSNCSLCSQMYRDVSIVISLIFNSSLRNTLLFEMSRSVAGDRSCCTCFLPSLHKTYFNAIRSENYLYVQRSAMNSRFKLLV